jgi:hypothetical protein
MSGCPASGLLETGLWFFELNDNGQLIAVELLADGGVTIYDFNELPPGADNAFVGELEWFRDGSRFIMLQSIPTGNALYFGTVTTDGTNITGTYRDSTGAEGSLSAEFQS